MYDEMQIEFNKNDYKAKEYVLLEGSPIVINANETHYSYYKSFEYPYGDINIELMWDTAGKPEEELDLKPLPDDEKVEKPIGKVDDKT